MSDARPRIGRIGAFRARLAGAAACRDGAPVTACPYSLDGTYEQRIKARYWVKGYSRAQMILAKQAAAK